MDDSFSPEAHWPMLRCTCCHRWTVEQIVLDDRPVLRVCFSGAPMAYCRGITQVQEYLDAEVYAALEPEPADGCE